MYSSTELDQATAVLVDVLQYQDISERVDRKPSTHSRTQGRGGAERSDGSTASKGSPAEIAAMIEREKAGVALEVEERLRKEYDHKLLSEQRSFAELIARFEEERSEYYARVEAEIVQLALAIAAKILHREAQVDPMLVAALVRIAVEKMREGSSVTLRVSPSRVDRWRRYFAEIATMAHVEVTEDPHLSDQDCLVGTELGSANFGLDTQLKEVEQGFFDLLALRPTSR